MLGETETRPSAIDPNGPVPLLKEASLINDKHLQKKVSVPSTSASVRSVTNNTLLLLILFSALMMLNQDLLFLSFLYLFCVYYFLISMFSLNIEFHEFLKLDMYFTVNETESDIMSLSYSILL